MNKPTILIVEDELVNRMILNKMLQDSYHVLEASDGATGWRILTENRAEIAAVLLDIVMPVMNGYQFLEKMRAAQMEELPVIVTTGTMDEDTERRALDGGAWDYVTKPYNVTILKTRLRNAIARSQLGAMDKLAYMADHDSLTGLYNRRKIFSKTRSMLEEHPGEKFVFLRLDIDHFAQYNTAFGEQEGDRLLMHMADCVVEAMRDFPYKTYGRISADIFCVCCPYDGDTDDLRARMATIQAHLAAYRRDYLLMLSSGVYLIERPDESIEDVYYRACLAAQQCKNQYGMHIAFYDSIAEQSLTREIAITNDMQTALDEKQFVVYLQPKYSLLTEKSCGAEALVRWQHPAKGMISPGAFIPVFEKNGFISKLDYYVWERTCQLLHEWRAAGYAPKPVSVNISRVSLYNPRLVEMINGLVRKYEIPTSLLELEITESAYMANPQLMEETINQLQAAGYTILMDDFGSGYSSLNTLKRIRVDVLKIDMKFLPVKEETERSEIILACIIKMAKWLGMSVVVEGVETRRQRDFLEGVGCEFVQGYYYAKPIPHAEYESRYVFAPETPAEVKQPVPSTEHVPSEDLTILIIDDSETDRAVLRESFKDMYHLHMSETAEEALAYLNRNSSKVKLILVDNFMPGMSGLEFLRFCRQEPALNAIPKIMITADDSTRAQVEAFNIGAYDYLTKPLMKEIFMARVSHVMDICRKASVFETLEHTFFEQSQRDPATGLLNKAAFHQLADRILAEAPETQEALLVFDIDNFKQINDRYGHLTGDDVILCIVNELNGTFRKSDVLGRFGGDEFIVMMTRVSNREVARTKAQEAIKRILISCGRDVNVHAGISVGIAFSRSDDTMDTLFSRADQALYEAKGAGKGTVIVYGEKVPPIRDDDKPIVLVCSTDPHIYPSIALAYGNDAAFAGVDSVEGLNNAFARYHGRIRSICIDMQDLENPDLEAFIECLTRNGAGQSIPVLAVYRESNMHQLCAAAKYDIWDVIPVPTESELVKRRLNASIAGAGALK